MSTMLDERPAGINTWHTSIYFVYGFYSWNNIITSLEIVLQMIRVVKKLIKAQQLLHAPSGAMHTVPYCRVCRSSLKILQHQSVLW